VSIRQRAERFSIEKNFLLFLLSAIENARAAHDFQLLFQALRILLSGGIWKLETMTPWE